MRKKDIAISTYEASIETRLADEYGGLRDFVLWLSGGDHADADDVAQEAVVRLLQKQEKGEEILSLGSWLKTVARRIFVDNARTRSRHARIHEKRYQYEMKAPIDDSFALKKYASLVIDEELIPALPPVLKNFMETFRDSGWDRSTTISTLGLSEHKFRRNWQRVVKFVLEAPEDARPPPANLLKSDPIGDKQFWRIKCLEKKLGSYWLVA